MPLSYLEDISNNALVHEFLYMKGFKFDKSKLRECLTSFISPLHPYVIVIDILNYCHGRSDRFITDSNKLLIREYMSELSVRDGINSEVVESIENNEDDQIIFEKFIY